MPNIFPILKKTNKADINGWIRPDKWLNIPEIADGEEVLYGLVAVFENCNNYIAFRVGEPYTVDWGDGNSENIAGYTVAEHIYNYADLPSTTEYQGYRQALVKITPQAGNNLIHIKLGIRHSLQMTGVSNFLDIVINTPQATLIGIVGDVKCYICERVWLKDSGLINGLYSVGLAYSISLRSAINVKVNASTQLCFRENYSIQTIPNIDFSLCTSLEQYFENCRSLKEFENTTTQNVANFYRCWYVNCSIQKIKVNCTSGDDFTQAFYLCYSLSYLILTNLSVSIDISNTAVKGANLDALANSVKDMTGQTAPSVTVRTDQLVGANQALFTNKNWTIVEV